RAMELPAAIRLLMIGMNRPVAEVAHQQVATEGAEARGRERQSPRCVEGALPGDTPHQFPIGVEHVDETAAGPGDVGRLVFVLPRVRDEYLAVDALDPEGREVSRDLLVDERAWCAHQVEAAVEDVDAGVVEVGGVELVAAGCRSDRETLV